jgi:hypothetical protein
MQPGVGYAATHSEAAFIIPPGPFTPPQFKYTFTGLFNNGIYNVPIYRNDSELNDFNWNLIGNPYPSAINADLFLAANYTDGAIFLWSQNTAPASATNGNQALNFSNDDYAIINGVGQLAGGDGVIPSRLIPSGQGFFVSMSNSAPASLVSGTIFTTNITFNNSMRVKGATDNSQFFKNSNTKNTTNTVLADKLWLNLTSDNGVFNQILVGYVNGATNNDDGTSFDAAKYPTKGSALYTTIEGSNKKYAIQGKDINSLNIDEIVTLGFKTTISVPTLYTLSIAQFEGDFLTNNTVYLIDNLVNKLHNLSASDYTFTSETGEFNNRFEIVFNASALSTNDVVSNANSLSIVELQDDYVQFNITNNLKIKAVSVFDLLGRQLYNFKGQNNTETYQLSNLSSTVYIAKVTLSNGAVITKKAVKK